MPLSLMTWFGVGTSAQEESDRLRREVTQLGEQAQAIPRLESKVSANEVLLTRTQEQVRRHQSIMAYCRCSCIGNENLSLTRESFYEFCAEDFIPSLHSAPLSQLLSSVMVFYENRETMYDILQLCMTYYNYVWHTTTMYDILQLCMTYYNYVWHTTAMYDILQLCMTYYSYVWHTTTMYDILQLCMTYYNYVWHTTTMYDILQPTPQGRT